MPVNCLGIIPELNEKIDESNTKLVDSMTQPDRCSSRLSQILELYQMATPERIAQLCAFVK